MAPQRDPEDVPLNFSPWQPALFSLILPGSGQFLLRRRWRGMGILVGLLTLSSLTIWLGGAWWLWALLAGIWLWNVLDS